MPEPEDQKGQNDQKDDNPTPPEVKKGIYSYGKGKTIELDQDIIDSINARVAAETHAVKEKHKSTSDELNALKTQMEEFKLSQMTEKEKAELAEQKRKDREASLEKKAAESESKLRNYFLTTELFKAVSEYKVHNPKQVVNLLKSEYPYEFIDSEDGNVQLVFNVGGNKISASEALKTFFDAAENHNLLISGLKPGGGTKPAGTSPDKPPRTVYKRSELKDQAISKEYREAIKQGIPTTIVEG